MSPHGPWAARVNAAGEVGACVCKSFAEHGTEFKHLRLYWLIWRLGTYVQFSVVWLGEVFKLETDPSKTYNGSNICHTIMAKPSP